MKKLYLKSRKFILDNYFNLQVKNLLKKHEFKIIPIGTYCLPRMITTWNKLKPSKQQGEKSCPFDLGFFTDIKATARLIKNKFNNFFDGLEYDKEHKQYVNKTIDAIFNHDGELNKKEFITRYKNRIKNFYDYTSGSSYRYFLLASLNEVRKAEIDELISALKTINPDNNFKLIFINQSKKTCDITRPELIVINQNHNRKNFDTINQGGIWGPELHHHKTHASQSVYYSITKELINAIRNTIK